MPGGEGKSFIATMALGPKELAAAHQASELERKISELFALFRLPVYRYLLGVVGHRDDAEEISQEVFLSLYSYLRKGSRVDNYRAWVFRVAHNMAINHQKRANPIESVEEAQWMRLCESRKDPAGNGEEMLLAKEKRKRVLKAMTLLSPQERHCLNLRAEGLSFREIGEVLAIRISTVETFIDRGIKKIAREING